MPNVGSSLVHWKTWVGIGALVVGGVLGLLIFGVRAVCAGMNLEPLGLFAYSAAYVFTGDPCYVSVVLGTILFWGGFLGLVTIAARRPLRSP